MTFKNLLQKHSWLSIAHILLELYPDEEKNISGYQDVFENLLMMQPKDFDVAIVLTHCKDDFDGEEYVDVAGKNKHPKTEEEAYSQAIEFTPWKEWLGMEIQPKSLDQFSELEIIAHCLYEMTFVSFEEQEIKDEIQRMEKDIEAFKNMTDEEKKANTTSIDELLKNLNEDDDEGDE